MTPELTPTQIALGVTRWTTWTRRIGFWLQKLSCVLNVPESEVVSWFTQQKQIIKEPLKPSDIAGVFCWLASEDTRLMTGQAISIDGRHEFPTY